MLPKSAAEMWRTEVLQFQTRMNAALQKPGKRGVTYAEAERILKANLQRAKARVSGTK